MRVKNASSPYGIVLLTVKNAEPVKELTVTQVKTSNSYIKKCKKTKQMCQYIINLI